MIVQQERSDDYVRATGEQHSVREFVEHAFVAIGRSLEWQGHGPDEKGFNAKTGEELVCIDARYFRPTEVETLLGDATKAHEKLGWYHRTGFGSLVREMVEADLLQIKRERLSHGE